MPPALKPPRLAPEILDDDASLGEAIDLLTRSDPRMDLLVREILHRQRELQGIADEEAWGAYLHLEMAVNARLVDLVGRIAKWAFEAGRDFERQGGRS